MNGLGMGTLGLGPDVATQSTSVAKPSVWDQINNAITKVVQPAANVYTQIKTGQSVPTSTAPAPTYTPPAPTVPLPVAPVQQDNTKKYLLIGGGVLLAGGVIYLLTRKKK